MNLAAGRLANGHMRLEPFAAHHRAPLIEAAADAGIWTHMPFPVLAKGYGAWFDVLMAEQEAGRAIPYAAALPDGRIVGQTCYLNLRPVDAGVEIGATWYAPEVQGGAVNPAAKLLLLGNAFDAGAERVELKTDALNTRSRAAILKLGATFEGLHRSHMRRADGSLRDTAWYSILRGEWPGVQASLEARLASLHSGCGTPKG